MASGHPILGIGMTECAMSELLDETRSGRMIEWDDAEGMKDFIDTCWEKFRNDDRTSDTADISGYSRRELTAKMARLMESLLE